VGQLAGRRKLPFRLAATSDHGTPHDPLTADPAALAHLLQASDLSGTPGLALERALEEHTTGLRDVMLLTHPRALDEADVSAAARRVPRGVRLFALTVDRHGRAELSEMRGGSPLSRSRFKVDMSPRPTPAVQAAKPTEGWSGPVEPVGYPFRFGIESSPGLLGFAFDHDGNWLLVTASGGSLLAVRTDGSTAEMLPRATSGRSVLTEVSQVLGVAGGFVVAGKLDGLPSAAHYDLGRRHCALFAVGAGGPGRWLYFRGPHTLLYWVGDTHHTFDLSGDTPQVSTGPPQRVKETPWMSGNENRDRPFGLLVQEPGPEQPPRGSITLECTGHLLHCDADGKLHIFWPREDGEPLLAGMRLKSAVRCRRTLAALCERPQGGPDERLWLFVFDISPRVYLGSVRLLLGQQYALSDDGLWLATAPMPSRVEVRAVTQGLPLRCQTPVGRFHSEVGLELGERWLLLRCHRDFYFICWHRGRLEGVLSNSMEWQQVAASALQGTTLARRGTSARTRALPPFLTYDPQRFRLAAWSNLIAAVDRFGQVALFERSGELLCMLFAFRGQWAAWMPDGTRWGSEGLLGRPATPEGDRLIGQALQDAWDRGEGTVTLP
jgi:hypothetical protein